MDPPPTGLLAGSMAPPPREAVFNPYRLPVSPPPGNIRPQPHRQPELLWLHWMVCLAAWTTEALCAHPIMAQEVPPDQHFETISARNIYIQTRRAVHEFNIQQRRIARGISLLQYVVPSPDTTTTFGVYRVNPNGFIRALCTPEDNLALGTAADEALLARRQSHRNYDSNSPPESPPTPATPATSPPNTTPTPARSRSRTPPPPNPQRILHDTSTSTSTPWTTSSRGSTPSTLSSALDRSHQHPLDGRGLLHGHLWQATRHRTPPTSTPAPSDEVLSPHPPGPSL